MDRVKQIKCLPTCPRCADTDHSACAEYHPGINFPFIHAVMIMLADREGPDQTARMCRLAWAFAVCPIIYIVAHKQYSGYNALNNTQWHIDRIVDITHEIILNIYITKTCLYNFDPLKPHFYTVKLGFAGVYIIFFYFCSKHRLWVLYLKIFIFFGGNIFSNLNRYVFVMNQLYSTRHYQSSMTDNQFLSKIQQFSVVGFTIP